MKKNLSAARKAAAQRPITLTGKGATPEGQAAAVAVQQEWAYAVATGIERGELPDEGNERRMIAAIVRASADQLKVPARKAGNPNAKIHDPDTAAVMVRMRERRGELHADALRSVADYFDVDTSRLDKICRERRAAVDDFFRGAVTIGKGRRNSRE